MPGNSFLGDLSEGIFSRLGELRQEQQTRDDAQRQQTLSFLSSLADKVEPESLPILMQQIGDVMGVKGKMKGFWNAFSGLPDRSVEDQLGTKLREVGGLLTGSDTARMSRESNLQQLLQPYRDQGSRPRQVSSLPPPSDLQGKIVFRDPRAEQLKLTEERYGLQAQAAAERQYMANQFKAQQQEDRQKFTKEMTDYKDNLKAEFEIKQRAFDLARKKGFKDPEFFMQEAARQIGQEQGWSNDKLQATTAYLRARTQESVATANALQKTGGIPPGQAMSIEDRRRENAADQKARYDKAMGVRAETQKRMDDIASSIETRLAVMAPGATFNRENGRIIPAKGDPGGAFREFAFRRELEEYGKMNAEKAKAEVEARGAYGNLKSAPYNKYYKPGATFSDPIQEVIGEPPSAPTAPSRPTLPLSPTAGKTSYAGALKIPPREGVTYSIGQPVTFRGRPYVIKEFDNDGNAVAVPRRR